MPTLLQVLETNTSYCRCGNPDEPFREYICYHGNLSTLFKDHKCFHGNIPATFRDQGSQHGILPASFRVYNCYRGNHPAMFRNYRNFLSYHPFYGFTRLYFGISFIEHNIYFHCNNNTPFRFRAIILTMATILHRLETGWQTLWNIQKPLCLSIWTVSVKLRTTYST